MTAARRQSIGLIVIFLVFIVPAAPVQVILEWRAGERPLIAELFRQVPTRANLRRLETDLERASRLARAVRPWMQFVRFILFEEAGDRALLGRDGWFFYRPAVQSLIEPSSPSAVRHELGPRGNMFDAIVSFRDDLARRGIRLLVMIAPNKASVYPDKLTARATERSGVVSATAREVVPKLREAGVEVVDLFDVYADARRTADAPQYYLVQDSHWSPDGMRLAAEVVARTLLDSGHVRKGTVAYQTRPVTVQRYGDVLRMMRVPQAERLFEPQTMHCTQVVDAKTGAPYVDDPNSPVLVLGDSFLRIFERDEPGSGGFVAHLALHLGFGLTSVINDGGASTLVRQQVARRPALLEGKKAVVWEFVERDIRFGTEGWQVVPLP